QARSFRTSSRPAREAANARPRRSSGRLASSQPRTSLRNASSRSVKSKFIWRRRLRPPLDSPAYTRGGGMRRFFVRRGLRPLLDSPAYTRGSGVLRRGDSLHYDAAVDVEGLARDVARFVGGEEDGGPADVLGGLLALHRRDVGHALVEHLARRHALEGRIRHGQERGERLSELGPGVSRSNP